MCHQPSLQLSPQDGITSLFPLTGCSVVIYSPHTYTMPALWIGVLRPSYTGG
jgi:hypothetical protein